jgi:hypothetical protein
MSQPNNLRGCHTTLDQDSSLIAVVEIESVELACRWHRTRNIAPTTDEAEAGPDGSARTASALAEPSR